jgi:hypothetical protein
MNALTDRTVLRLAAKIASWDHQPSSKEWAALPRLAASSR